MPNTRRLSCFIGTLAGRRNEPGVFKGAGKADDFTAVGKVPEIPIIPVKTAEIFDSACHFPAQPAAGNMDRFRPDVSNFHTHRNTHMQEWTYANTRLHMQSCTFAHMHHACTLAHAHTVQAHTCARARAHTHTHTHTHTLKKIHNDYITPL